MFILCNVIFKGFIVFYIDPVCIFLLNLLFDSGLSYGIGQLIVVIFKQEL